jgi:hypothetical protein
MCNICTPQQQQKHNGKTTMETTTTNNATNDNNNNAQTINNMNTTNASTDNNATTTTNNNNDLFVVVTIDNVEHRFPANDAKLIGTLSTTATTTPYKRDNDGKFILDKHGKNVLDETRQQTTTINNRFDGCTVGGVCTLSTKPTNIREQRVLRETAGKLPTVVNTNVVDAIPKPQYATMNKIDKMYDKLTPEQQREIFIDMCRKNGMNDAMIETIMQTWKPTT